MIGNSMTGASLAVARLAAEFQERPEKIETALCLGGSVQMAAMGLVLLPGMMTGQILSGTEPLLAVQYQIAIMCVMTGSVSLTTFLILRLGYRSYFIPYQSLREV